MGISFIFPPPPAKKGKNLAPPLRFFKDNDPSLFEQGKNDWLLYSRIPYTRKL